MFDRSSRLKALEADSGGVGPGRYSTEVRYAPRPAAAPFSTATVRTDITGHRSALSRLADPAPAQYLGHTELVKRSHRGDVPGAAFLVSSARFANAKRQNEPMSRAAEKDPFLRIGALDPNASRPPPPLQSRPQSAAPYRDPDVVAHPPSIPSVSGGGYIVEPSGTLRLAPKPKRPGSGAADVPAVESFLSGRGAPVFGADKSRRSEILAPKPGLVGPADYDPVSPSALPRPSDALPSPAFASRGRHGIEAIIGRSGTGAHLGPATHQHARTLDLFRPQTASAAPTHHFGSTVARFGPAAPAAALARGEGEGPSVEAAAASRLLAGAAGAAGSRDRPSTAPAGGARLRTASGGLAPGSGGHGGFGGSESPPPGAYETRGSTTDAVAAAGAASASRMAALWAHRSTGEALLQQRRQRSAEAAGTGETALPALAPGALPLPLAGPAGYRADHVPPAAAAPSPPALSFLVPIFASSAPRFRRASNDEGDGPTAAAPRAPLKEGANDDWRGSVRRAASAKPRPRSPLPRGASVPSAQQQPVQTSSPLWLMGPSGAGDSSNPAVAPRGRGNEEVMGLRRPGPGQRALLLSLPASQPQTGPTVGPGSYAVEAVPGGRAQASLARPTSAFARRRPHAAVAATDAGGMPAAAWYDVAGRLGSRSPSRSAQQGRFAALGPARSGPPGSAEAAAAAAAPYPGPGSYSLAPPAVDAAELKVAQWTRTRAAAAAAAAQLNAAAAAGGAEDALFLPHASSPQQHPQRLGASATERALAAAGLVPLPSAAFTAAARFREAETEAGRPGPAAYHPEEASAFRAPPTFNAVLGGNAALRQRRDSAGGRSASPSRPASASASSRLL